MLDVPFTKFSGFIGSIDLSAYGALGRQAFALAFSEFEGQQQVADKLKTAGVEYVISARGLLHASRGRERRFAGDSSLERSRYFALSSGNENRRPPHSIHTLLDNGGTLLNELTAYYSHTGGVDVEITDSNVHTERVAEWVRRKLDLRFFPFIAITIKGVQETDAISSVYNLAGKVLGSSVLLMYEVCGRKVGLDHVVDLRVPDTQEWFTRFFVDLECSSEQAAMDRTGLHFQPKRRIADFAHVLPVLLSPELGGAGTFSQAVGAWLRAHGADALIYPSARSNASAEVVRGRLHTHGGWNIVVYSGSASPDWRDRFGMTTSWSDPDLEHIRVEYIASGVRRGTLTINGPLQYNRHKFQLERDILYGRREASIEAYRSIIGSQQEELTKKAIREMAQGAVSGI